MTGSPGKYEFASGHGIGGSIYLPNVNGVLFSKDYNDDGKMSWLGFDLTNNIMTKCFCGSNVTDKFEYGVNLSSWTTSNGRLLNLEHFGYSF